ncbi:glycoside hydrolase family 5 protein [Streptomyces gobiensis]|uniref:glycoside hydrolase family 5 protein n=1 Tax=Streptomyces gobiensis TaxID=2875706 RepID=UPI001E5BD787|nr:glycoside hydrolase family 5 protein [Streptomyces gobiensis]UGY91048.1 glycoside hydrolase family 5 protein [Streptomyces gobiensis]
MAVELCLLAVNATGDRGPGIFTEEKKPVVEKGTTGVEAKPETPVERHGKLHVCGTQLCNAAGNPVQLRGMSTSGTQWFADCLVDDALDVLAEDWGSSVLRIATYADKDGYAGNPKKFTALANRLIDMASARGMYVIVDWHWVDPGDPNEGLDNAMTFFKEITKRHQHKPNVIYEIMNEAFEASWWMIKSYAEKIIPVIRARDPDSVILVGTRGWSTLGLSEYANEREVVANPVRASNIMYTYHFYAAAHREEFLRTLDRASSKLPVFVSEWGTQSWTGFDNDFAMSQRYIDLMARKKISWTYWSISDGDGDGDIFKKGTCKGGRFAGTSALKPAGVWIRERIRG